MSKDTCSIGELDKRIIIENSTEVDDGYGGKTISWATFATVWARVKPLKGFEKLRAMQIQSEVTHKITIRYRSGITTGMRVNFNSRIFNIKSSININEDDQWLEIIAEEGVGT